jgi:hypothetical protein
VIKKKIQEDNNPNYIIADLFFYRDIANGELLSTSEGLLLNQSERAAIFVPPGGGAEYKPVFQEVKIDEHTIILKKVGSNYIVSYHLFCFSGKNGALILVLENGVLQRLISYSGTNEGFIEMKLDDFFPADISNVSNPLEFYKINKNFVSVSLGTKKTSYIWQENKFQEASKD